MDNFKLKLWACTLVGKFSNTKLCINLNQLKTEQFEGYLDLLWKKVPKDIIKAAQRELSIAQEKGVRLLSINDCDYPKSLAEIQDPPLLIFVQGQLPTSDSIAVVGSRRCSSYGKKFAKAFSILITQSSLSVVSGLATGIDTFAHQGAIEFANPNHPGIGVLGCGLNHIYPAHNKGLYDKLLATGGALISEFGLFTEPRNYLFPRRNRIISGLSKAVIVIEASEKSGSLITARIANEQGRDVLALPGPIDSNASSGCNKLIADGARIICSEQDLAYYLEQQGLGVSIKQAVHRNDYFLEKIRSTSHTVETLSQELKIPIPELYPKLLELELKGQLSISISGLIEPTH